MKQLSSFSLLSMDSVSHSSALSDDSATPRIIKNIERISKRYRDYVQSEITEDIDTRSEQVKRIKKLQEKESKDSK